jgi:hypothetical protein
MNRTGVIKFNDDVIEPICNILFCTMIDPVCAGARSCAQTVIPLELAVALTTRGVPLLNLWQEHVLIRCGMMFAGTSRGYIDMIVFDSMDSCKRYESIVNTCVKNCVSPKADCVKECYKAQVAFGYLFGFSETIPELLENTPPNPSWLDQQRSCPITGQLFPFTAENVRLLKDTYYPKFPGKI